MLLRLLSGTCVLIASKRETLGAAAKEVIAANQGATKRSLERLAEFLK